MPKFETKNVILGFFRLKFKKLLSYLKLTPSDLSKCKYPCKIKKFKSGTRNALFGYFSGCNFEKVLSHLKLILSKLSKCKVSCKI